MLLAASLSGCGGRSGTVTPPTPPPPIFVTLGLPDGVVGVAYSFTLQALSGLRPFTWSVSQGSLPAGLSLNASTGQITGTPTTVGTQIFTVRVADSANQSVTQEFTVAIGDVPPLVERVSLAADGGQANSDSGTPSLSNDGRFMAFTSFATNLVATDTNNFPDVFLRDFFCQDNVLVSVSSTGTQTNNISFNPVVSGLTGGHVFVAYVSTASNLVANDTNNGRDVFATALDVSSCPPVVEDTIRVSVASDGAEATLSSTQPPSSLLPSISANGKVVTYQSDAVNLNPDDTNNATDVFATDLDFSGGALSFVRTRRVSLFQARLSLRVGRTTADIVGPDRIGNSTLTMMDHEHMGLGRKVFISDGTGAGQIRGIADNNATTLFVDRPWNPVPTSSSVFRILSRELLTAGVFSSTTLGNSNLTMQDKEHVGQLLEIVAGTGAGPRGQRRLVTDNNATTFTVDPPWSPEPAADSQFRLLRQSNAGGLRARVSPDAAFVLFDSSAPFEEEDNNNASDVFLYDLAADDTVRLTRDSLGRPGNGISNSVALSGDANLALVLSNAFNLAPVLPPTPADIFSSTTIGNLGLALTPDAHIGQFVLIVEGVGVGESRPIAANTATTLTVEVAFSPVPNATSVFIISDDTNNQSDLYLLDRTSGQFTRVSRASDGSLDNGAEDPNALISAKGAAVVFSSVATNLVPGDRNNVRDIYLRNLNTNTTSRISRALGDTNPNAESVDPALSLDGSAIAFSSTATNLVPDDTNSARDIFRVTTGINDPPMFVFSKLAAARVGQPYTQQLPALGGRGSLFWSIANGSLPPGLFLDSTSGALTGVPQKAGRYQFTLLVTDAARPPRQALKTITLVVDP